MSSEATGKKCEQNFLQITLKIAAKELESRKVLTSKRRNEGTVEGRTINKKKPNSAQGQLAFKLLSF